ncbi:hypothetical protein [Janthinobacterium rivuli]|uniref:hypothetical protein n=1 Tax=Janthinobacterium rivuli TaxID=2751478 RepID=UPI00383B3197
MMALNNVIDDFEDESGNFESAMKLIEDIKARCEKAEIKYVDSSTQEDSYIDVCVQFPAGRDTKDILLYDFDDLKKFQAINFENYKLVGNYAAIVSYDLDVIEAVISVPGMSLGAFRMVRRMLGILRPDNEYQEIVLESGSSGSPIIKLKDSSAELQIIAQSGNLKLSIEITNSKVKSNEQAIDVLKKYSDSLFFAIDAQKNMFLSLVRRQSKRKYARPQKNEVPLEFPRNFYENASIDLFWYARSAARMPLLQFLAYYQSIEFHYPAFYNADVGRKVKSILKNPSFRIENESDIARVVAVIKSNGKGFASEKDQLKATLKECINNDDIENFIRADKERSKYFMNTSKGVSKFSINIQNPSELYNQVADRIYDIRCKIVHTKGDEGNEELDLLLPYSKEADNLQEDIELIRLLAQKVIIYTSK